jgi:crotonobetainyl-CoA:carnitine CoA-transferase CaiB-like acyl-CoA transferase
MRPAHPDVVPAQNDVSEFPAAPPGPLAGLTVVELGRFASAPSCATLLADWGAHVIKIEPPEGDPARGPGSVSSGSVLNPRFDVHNRSRQSVALDLTRPAAVAAAHRLVHTADVLVTNLRPSALRRIGMDAPTVRALSPRLVYGHITGYGLDTARADVRSYDHGAFWSYTGLADLFTGPHGEPPQPAGGLGDRASGGMLAAGILAALFARAQSGAGDYVTTSLVTTGLWLAASDAADALATGAHRPTERLRPPVPTVNCFRTRDARWLWLQVMLPARDWPQLVTVLGAPQLDEDPRFRGGTPDRLKGQGPALVAALDEIFAQRTLAEWGTRLDQAGLTWAPVRTLGDTLNDDQIRGSSGLRTIRRRNGGDYQAINTPITFGGTEPAAGFEAPLAGEHTEAVLTELGYTATEIASITRPADDHPTAATVEML